ncbi:Uncharacterised protein [Clostridium perfringens]|nr:hypothetical protein [Clostridium perfringens]SQC85462.1 Uncharacterised protein [Clostridium perfringens]
MNEIKNKKIYYLAKSLSDILKEEYNPHTQIIINSENFRITEDISGVPFNDNGFSTEFIQTVDEVGEMLDKAISNLRRKANGQVYHWANEQQFNIQPSYENGVPCLIIPTLEGEMICSLGDY